MIKRRGIRAMLSSNRAAQAGWGVFLLASLSLALPGLSPYLDGIQTVCAGAPCLMGQVNPQVAAAASLGGSSLIEYGQVILVVYLFSAAALLVTGFILIWLRPAHPAAVSAAFLFVAAAVVPFAQAVSRTGSAGLRAILFALLLPTFALLPDGRFQPRWLGWLAVGLAPFAALAAFDQINPPGATVVGAILGIAVIGSLVYRLLVEKQRQEALTWTLIAAVLLGIVQLIGQPVLWLPLPFMEINLFLGTGIPPHAVFGTLLLVGGLTCLAVALLGDELFRVDVALNRAIVYSFLTIIILGIYSLIVGYLSIIFQTSGSFWFSLVATGMVAVLFQPIRERVQRFVNRMIYGDRDDPYTVIARLGQRLETVIASDEVIPAILGTVREALKVSYAAITLEQPEGTPPPRVAEEGQRKAIILTVPLMVQNEVIGYLELGPRQGENAFTPADRRLLEGLARQAGVAIHAARLNADLKRARERLVIAQEEERRRIRRDLHDGLGASLAALSLQAGEVQRLTPNLPDEAARRMQDLRAGLRAAVGDTRRLVYGLRPPALDELGLLEALRSRVAQYQGGPDEAALQICLDAPATLPDLPAAVEVAIYRIVEEGLANIIHHSQAAHGKIIIALADQGVRVEICDDGAGLPDTYQHGIGLNSMRERATELGGTWSIQSTPGQATQISAWLPLLAGPREE